MQHNIHEQARGKWRAIHAAVGINAKYLSPRHGPCPLCNGGKDRFRWSNEDGSGSYFCNQCGPGTGVDLVMKSLKMSFKEAVQEIEKHIGSAKIEMPKQKAFNPSRIADDLWNGGFNLDGNDPASLHLKSRGIDLSNWPASLRYNPNVSYRHENGSQSWHPAMVARMVGPDEKQATTHITYLTKDGQKADVPKAKQKAPGKGTVPAGGAVRLYRDAETMGIAEGIETALSAMIIDRIPVWAALDTIALAKWQPPKFVKHVIVYADNDGNCAGQKYAFALANRLIIHDKITAEVRLPSEPDSDWNDELPIYQSPARRNAG